MNRPAQATVPRAPRARTALFVILLLLTACVTDDSDDPEATDDSSEDADPTAETVDPDDQDPEDSSGEQIVRIAVGSFGNDTMDPAMDDRQVISSHHSQMWDYLLEIAPDGDLAPGVAESWEVDDSGTVWTFHLREGIEFHDDWGALTSADVKFSLERFSAEEAVTGAAPTLRRIIDRIETPDDYTVEIYTIGVQSSLLYLLSPHTQATGIVFPSRYLLEEAGEDFLDQQRLLDERPIGSGPFRFVSRQAGASIEFEATGRPHWRNTPAIDGIEVVLVPEPATQVAMLQAGEIDIINIEGDQVPQAEGAGADIYTLPRAADANLIFSGWWRPPAADKPTADPMVRRALSLAIDRQAIVDNIAQGYGELALTPLKTSPATADIRQEDYVDWAQDHNRFDMDEAQRLLEEAGYGDGFSLELWMGFSRPLVGFLPDIGEYVEAQWRELGLDVQVQSVDYETYRPLFLNADLESETAAGEPATHGGALQFSALGALNGFFAVGSSIQLGGSEEIDQRIVEAEATIDDDARADLVRGIFEDINEGWPYIQILNIDALFAVSPEAVSDMATHDAWPFLSRSFETIEP